MFPMRHLFAGIILALITASAARADVSSLVTETAARIATQQREHVAELRAMAQTQEVLDYFLAPEDRRGIMLGKVQDALGGRKMGSELCLIDEHGSEHLRAVHGRLAPSSELAHNEVSAPFFKPSITLNQGEAHVSKPYPSPDVLEWVVGYVVPVLPGKAILHFEHPIADLRKALPTNARGEDRFMLLVDENGFILGDSTREVPLAVMGDKTEPATYFSQVGADDSRLPAQLVKTMLSQPIGTLDAAVAGRSWKFSWSRVANLTVIGGEAAR